MTVKSLEVQVQNLNQNQYQIAIQLLQNVIILARGPSSPWGCPCPHDRLPLGPTMTLTADWRRAWSSACLSLVTSGCRRPGPSSPWWRWRRRPGPRRASPSWRWAGSASAAGPSGSGCSTGPTTATSARRTWVLAKFMLSEQNIMIIFVGLLKLLRQIETSCREIERSYSGLFNLTTKSR